jgi:hypothetical protein
MKTIKKNNKNFIECNVVLTKTDKNSSIFKFGDFLSDMYDSWYKIPYGNGIGQDMHLVVDGEIKGGDFIIHKDKVYQVLKNRGLFLSIDGLDHIDIRTDLCKKIIASTDILVNNSAVAGMFGYLPHPTKLFIEEFIKKHNKNEKIDKVLVEVTARNDFKDISDALNGDAWQIKIDEENEINILIEKEKIYSQKEMEDFGFKVWKHLRLHFRGADEKTMKDEYEKWIFENLK